MLIEGNEITDIGRRSDSLKVLIQNDFKNDIWIIEGVHIYILELIDSKTNQQRED